MNIKEIKQAVDNGLIVYWSSLIYTVVKSKSDYFIKCSSNGRMIKLSYIEEGQEILNGEESEFFTK